jgi:hypothetical protein
MLNGAVSFGRPDDVRRAAEHEPIAASSLAA